jgi:hypothetical protein
MDRETKFKITNFAKRIVCGEVMTSPEDLQFYLNYRVEIEEVLKTWSED